MLAPIPISLFPYRLPFFNTLKMFLFFFLLLRSGIVAQNASTSTTPYPLNCTSSTAQSYSWSKNQEATQNLDTHLCLLNYPSSQYCEYWRVAPLILLTDKNKADANTKAIKAFLSTVTENCDQKSALMPFIPANLNEDCRSFQFTSIDWIGNLTSPKVLVPEFTAVEIFEDLITSLFKCTQYELSDSTAGAVFIFTDLTCEPLCQSSSFGTLINSLIVNISSTSNYVTTTYFLGNYSEIEQTCLSATFLFCALYRNQICAVDFYSNLTEFATNGQTEHTCAVEQQKIKSETKLILVIVIPCVLLTLLIVIATVIIIRNRSRQKWFKFWWEHTKGESIRNISRRVDMSRNEYYDTSTLAKRKDDWEINRKLLKIKEDDLLGHGAFAIVYKGLLLEPPPLSRKASVIPHFEEKLKNGFEVAVKKLPAKSDDQSRSEFMKELDFMKSLGLHTHIIGLLGCVTEGKDPMIVVEFCYHGDLLNFLRKNRGTFVPDGAGKQADANNSNNLKITMKELLSFSWQIGDGMVYLSSRSFIHRDLAARNVFLTKDMVAKIGDFGLCREVDTALYTTHGGRLPIKWMAIESLKFYEYTAKSDVWSYAVLLFEIFSFGETPYQTVQPADLVEHLEKGNRLPKTEHCPREVFEIMTRCWKKNPEDRPTFFEIREEIGVILNKRDELYGYLPLDSCQAEEKYIDPIAIREEVVDI